MKVLGIFGAGGQGIEILDVARTINDINKTWDKFIFVNNGDPEDPIDDVEVMGLEKALELYSGDLYAVIGVGEPTLRLKIAKQLIEYGIPAATLISPNVRVPHTTTIEEGACIFPNVYLSSNTTIGRNVLISPNAVIGHDVIIEDNVVISAGAIVCGMVNAKKNSYIGPGAVIKENLTVGENAVASMGSVVFKDINDGDVVVGNPARVSIRSSERLF